MRIQPIAVLLASIFLASVCHASSRPRVPLTTKEVAQGYRDTVVLAKPRLSAAHDAPVAAAMSTLSVRDAFPRLGHVQVLEVPAGKEVTRWIKELERTGQYEFVEPDQVMTADLLPDDPGFAQQWPLRNDGAQNDTVEDADIDAELAWEVDYDASDVIVAVIDSGAKLDHPDLAANLWRNPAPTIGDLHGIRVLDGVRDTDLTDESGHGTGVASVIGAVGNNTLGLTGVAWKARLMILKNGNSEGRSLTSDSIACIDYAIAHGARVINCSFGGRAYSNALYAALKAARDAGVIVVCAAGNNGTNSDTSPHYPANYLLDNVVAVGNSTGADEVSSTTNFGSSVDLLAPGTSIPILDHKDNASIRRVSGTSFSAPHVTGGLALLRSTFPNETYLQLINRLLRGADRKSQFGGSCATNARLNLYTPLLSGTKTTPQNDEFARRAIIVGSDLSLRTNSTGATLETAGGETLHGSAATGSLWWHWIAAESGRVQVTTTGSAYDTALAVYTAEGTPTLTGLTAVTTNDDDGTAKTSRVVFEVTQFKSYLISVAGVNGGAGFTQLNISLETPNDHFAKAEVLTGASTRATGKNRSASMESGEPTILGLTTRNSIWYKWTAPLTQRVQVSLFTTHFDTLLAVYTGTSLANLTLVTANDDTNTGTLVTNTDSRCELNATAGTTYYFQAASSSDRAGDVTIAITDSLWQFSNGGGDFGSSPAVGRDGTIYLGSGYPDSTLYAVNPDGSLKWVYPADGSLDTASPAIADDGTIYQAAYTGQLLALKPDGTLKWKRTFDQYLLGGVALAADGTVYCRTEDGKFYALNPADGTTRWAQQTGAKSTLAGCAIAPDGTIYQPSDTDHYLYAMSPDGAIKWRADLGGSTHSTPALDGLGNIYVATFSTSRVLSLTPAGTLRWNYAATANASRVSSSPVLSADGRTVYIGVADNKLHALEAETGNVRWTYECGSYIYVASPAVDANGVIYIGCYDGKLYAVTSEGKLKRTWDFGQIIRGSPVIAGTTLYLGANDQKLYAFEIGASAAGGPWPQYRQNARRQSRANPDPLGITLAPASAVLTLGETRTLQVVAQGQGPLTFQWSKDGQALAGETGSRLILSNTTTASAGSYTVTVSGPQGSVTSPAAVLSLPSSGDPTEPGTPDTRGRLMNLSVRCRAGTGSQTVIVGMSIGPGTGGDKPLLLRGMGPSLAVHGVTNVIPDPVLTVFSGSTAMASNDGWRGDPVISAAAARVYAFPFASQTSLDAAMYTALASGAYTVQITGRTGTGVALVELYDGTESAALTATAPRLLNVSARTQVGTGGDVLIAGFAVAGGSERLLIRAVGPKLAEYGVSGVLANPKLELFKGDDKIKENDDWGGAAEIVDAAKQVWAFGLDPASKDACLLVTLPAGIYSTVVKGVGDTTGVALVEVYAVP